MDKNDKTNNLPDDGDDVDEEVKNYSLFNKK